MGKVKRGITYLFVDKYAKEESFGSTLSRKACEDVYTVSKLTVGGVPQSPRQDTKMYDKVPKRNKTLMLAKMRGLYTKKYERVGKVHAPFFFNMFLRIILSGKHR